MFATITSWTKYAYLNTFFYHVKSNTGRPAFFIETGRATFYSIFTQITLACTQSAFTCSKLTIETLEQGVKYVRN